MKNNSIIGISRVRNEGLTIKATLDHLSSLIDGVVIYDDCSEDNTLEIIENHSLVLEVIKGEHWESHPKKRALAEGDHRQVVYKRALNFSPDWIYCFDADEYIEFKDDLDLTDLSKRSYYFRLYDFYITKNDINDHYLERKFLGPEYRKIPMLFHNSLKLDFQARVPKGLPNSYLGGDVKHYGKAISIEEWEKKCQYYINHLFERQPGKRTIREKWLQRVGKAIHIRSDFNHALIKWSERELKGIELREEVFLKRNRPLKILLASSRLSKLSGCETFTYTMAEEIKARNIHEIEYFTFEKGIVSKKMENELGIHFMSKKKYDLILANHNTVVKHLKGRGIIIQTCHGIYPQLEQPSNFADGYVSISEEVSNHLAKKNIPSLLIHNSINLNRFSCKKKISTKLEAVLSMCHSSTANKMVKEVCQGLGLKYYEAFKYSHPVWEVENKINQADLVIGLGRSVYEAFACGRPVVIFDDRPYFKSYGDGYVKNKLVYSLKHNCSGRYFKKEFNKEKLEKEIRKYNAKDSSYFRDFAVRELNVEVNVNKYLDYYYLLKQEDQNNHFSFIKILKKIKNRIKIGRP